MKVAIDGPAGCGKSTIAKMIAENLGFLYINSGNLYRAIAFLTLQEGISWQDTNAMISLVKRHTFDYLPDGTIVVDGRPLSKELRSPQIDAIVSQVSSIPEIRTIVNNIIQKISQGKNVISEGRDITTVVFPDAEVKIYLDASPRVRAERRYRELCALQKSNQTIIQQLPSIEEIQANIDMRDRLDKNKAVGALQIAPDALYVDTSDLTIAQVYDKVYKILTARMTNGRD